jgi:hypothetical protein
MCVGIVEGVRFIVKLALSKGDLKMRRLHPHLWRLVSVEDALGVFTADDAVLVHDAGLLQLSYQPKLALKVLRHRII